MRSLTESSAQLKQQIDSYQCELERDDLPLNAAMIDSVSRTVGYRGRRCFWMPTLTVWTFLRQILHGNCSCRAAVAMTISGLAAHKADQTGDADIPISSDPSAYAQARSRLPLKWFETFHRRVADDVRRHVDDARRWCRRRVFVVDGATLNMPDTPSLQAAFPQPSGQKPGCGSPQLRLAAVFCHASGALLDLAADSLRAQELPLFRRMLDRFQPGDVVVADRAYQSYADVVDWQSRGIDSVVRFNEAPKPKLRCRRRLGDNDKLMTWRRPRNRIRRLTREQWLALPESIEIRQVGTRIATKGFRTRSVMVLTTLLDDAAYPAEKIAELYRDRWMAELNLRSLKTTLKMEVLSGKSPDIVRKEVLMYAATYNLIRSLMWQAALQHAGNLRRLSFAGTQQRIAAMLPFLESCQERRSLMSRLLADIVADRIPDRPDRIEPRAVKRRRKSYMLLSKPRRKYREELRKNRAS